MRMHPPPPHVEASGAEGGVEPPHLPAMTDFNGDGLGVLA